MNILRNSDGPAMTAVLRFTVPLLLFASFVADAPRATADPLRGPQTTISSLAEIPEPGVPNRYGEVIFSSSGNGDRHLYIIGQSHRSPVNGKNGDKTIQAQVEAYHIGEWLIRQRGVELLLPEGFFDGPAGDGKNPGRKIARPVAPAVGVADVETIRHKLTDTDVFADAALLLKNVYGLRFGQVEDEGLYRTVADTYGKLNGPEGREDPGLWIDLGCYQEQRTAAMLQGIPSVIERQFRSGSIANEKAIFFIGMAHVAKIVQYLREGSIELTPPRGASELPGTCELALREERYGVTVIVPRSLFDDEKILRLTKLAETLDRP